MPTQAARHEKTAAAFRSIGEAASELGLQTHVLRFWETKFRQLSPVKRRDGRRFYRPEDMEVLRAIQLLVHERGMTIKGAQALLAAHDVASILAGEARVLPLRAVGEEDAGARAPSPALALQETVRAAFGEAPADGVAVSPEARQRLESVLADITDIKRRLDAVRLRRAA